MEHISLYSYTKSDLSRIPRRTENSNKGTYGRLLCVCGSAEMTGAAYLCAKAAYRTGAGLVEIFTHESNRTPLASLLPEAIISTYSDTPDLGALRSALQRADAIALGCGLGTSLTAKKLVYTVLTERKAPCVADADALNIIASDTSLRALLRGCIITPHPLEYSRLSGVEVIDDTVANAPTHAQRLAQELACVCVLKTHRTAVSDGSVRVYQNNCGNSGMATGGSGDVLVGIIGGILAQMKRDGADPLLAATLGVYIHALAGNLAACTYGEYSLMASDIINSLPSVLKDA